LQALADGDLTVKLKADTKAASGFSNDELGRIMSRGFQLTLQRQRGDGGQNAE
jgi:hypothetical protein